MQSAQRDVERLAGSFETQQSRALSKGRVGWLSSETSVITEKSCHWGIRACRRVSYHTARPSSRGALLTEWHPDRIPVPAPKTRRVLE